MRETHRTRNLLPQPRKLMPSQETKNRQEKKGVRESANERERENKRMRDTEAGRNNERVKGIKNFIEREVKKNKNRDKKKARQ